MKERRQRIPPEVLPIAPLPEGTPEDRRWELMRIAYEAHFELARYYASVMFQARIAITTVMVFAVVLGFGFLPMGDSGTIEFAGVPARGLASYVAALLINLLHAMEVKYVLRFYRIVESGRRIERDYEAPAYFSGYERSDSWPLYVAYLGGVVVLVGIFLGAAWLPAQSVPRSLALILAGALPVGAFVRSYVQLDRAGRTLLDSPHE